MGALFPNSPSAAILARVIKPYVRHAWLGIRIEFQVFPRWGGRRSRGGSTGKAYTVQVDSVFGLAGDFRKHVARSCWIGGAEIRFQWVRLQTDFVFHRGLRISDALAHTYSEVYHMYLKIMVCRQKLDWCVFLIDPCKNSDLVMGWDAF